jgi:hypothetical protein
MTKDQRPDEGPFPDNPTPENMVSYSEQLLNQSIARLTRILETYDDLPASASKDLVEEFRSLRKAVEIAYHERAHLQKLKAAEGAGGSAAALDLGAARTEIARRLAVLRAAGPDTGVSGQPE